MQRADALEEPGEKIEELSQRRRDLWRDTVGEPDGDPAAYAEDPRDRPDARRSVPRAREAAHAPPAAGSRSSSSISRASRRATRRAEKTDLLRKIARVFEEKLDDKNQALDALINALGEDFHDRETARTSSGWRRPPAAGARSSRPRTTGSKQQTEPQQKIRLCLHLAKWYGDDLGHPEYAQPYYAQIVQLDPNNVGALRQMGQLYREERQLAAARRDAHARARRRDQRRRSQRDPHRARRAARRADEPDRSGASRTSSARSRSTRTSFPALENLERIYAARGQNRELVDVLTRKVPALTDAGRDRARPSCASARSTRRASATRRARRRSTARCSSVDAANLQALRGLGARLRGPRSSGPTSSASSRRELDVVTTERERIDVLMQLATLQEEHFLKADIAAQRLEQVLEIDPNHEEAYFALERNYRKLRQWLDLINTYDRHIAATLDRKTKVELYGAIAQVYADEVEDSERAIDAYQNIVDLDEHERPGARSAREALRQAGRRGAVDRLHDARRGAHAGHEAARRVVLPDRQGARREARRPRGGAGALRDGARSRSVAPADAWRRSARSRSTTPTTTRPRATSIRSRATPQAPRQRARAPRRARQAPRGDARRSRQRRPRLGGRRTRPIPRTRTRRCRSSTSTSRKRSWEQRRAARSTCSSARAGKRERGEQHDSAEQARAGLRGARARTRRRSRPTPPRTSSISPTRSTIRGLAEVCFRLKDWGAALTNFQKVLTALGEDETEAARRRLLQARLHQARAGAGQAGDQQLREGPRRRRRAPADARSAGRALHRAQGLEAGRRLQAADPRQRRRRATSASGCSTRSRDVWNDQDKNPRKAIEALEEALDLQPQNHVPAPQAPRALPGDRELVEDDRHPPGHRRHREGRRSARASSSTRWRSSIATRRATRIARSSSSTRRSI